MQRYRSKKTPIIKYTFFSGSRNSKRMRKTESSFRTLPVFIILTLFILSERIPDTGDTSTLVNTIAELYTDNTTADPVTSIIHKGIANNRTLFIIKDKLSVRKIRLKLLLKLPYLLFIFRVHFNYPTLKSKMLSTKPKSIEKVSTVTKIITHSQQYLPHETNTKYYTFKCCSGFNGIMVLNINSADCP